MGASQTGLLARLLGLYAAACVCVGLGTGCLVWFMQAGWFHDPAGSYGADWTGYTAAQFVGLLGFTLLGPLGVMLLLGALQQTTRATAHWGHAHHLVLLATLAVLVTLTALGGVWSAEIMQCMAVGCTNPAKWAPPAVPRPEAGIGFQVVVGAAAMFASGMLAVALLWRWVRELLPPGWGWGWGSGDSAAGANGSNSHSSSKRGASANISETSPLLAYDDAASAPAAGAHNGARAPHQFRQQQLNPSGPHLGGAPPAPVYQTNLVKAWLVYVLVFGVLVALFISTTIVPNSWEYFTANRIASYAAQQTTHYPTLCNVYPLYSCPEYEWAFFKTVNIRLHSYLYLKFFPGNVMFYVFLALAPLLALLAKTAAQQRPAGGRSPLQAKVKLPRSLAYMMSQGYFSLGELCVVVAMLLLCIFWTIYWMHDHNYNGYWPTPTSKVFYSEKVARCLGQLAVLLMSLLLFPTARGSLLGLFFGTSWESALRYHRWLGSAFFLVAIAHMVGNYVWYHDVGDFPADMMTVPMHLKTSIDNFTVPLISIVLWLCIITIGVLAMVWTIRRTQFEWFMYAHHITYLTLIPAVLWHAAAGWEFLLPGLLVWFTDRCLRFYRSGQAVHVVHVEAHDYGKAGWVTELVCTVPFTYYPGHYAFLNVAEISLLDWHPFTISSASSGRASFHIKDMGDGTFTGRLRALAEQGVPLTVSVDGPYGTPLDLRKYESIVLVAGGIGITPCKSIFEHLQTYAATAFTNLKRAHLIWATRDAHIFRIMESSLEHVGGDDVFTAELFVSNTMSNAGSAGDVQDRVPLEGSQVVNDARHPLRRSGRPHVPTCCKNIGLAPSTRTLLFVCGPDAMVADAEDIAHSMDWDMHSETFLL